MDAPMVPVINHQGKYECVNLKRLNESVQREKFVLPTLDDILHRLAGNPVSPTWMQRVSSGRSLCMRRLRLTTFIMLLRRFCFKRPSFSITSAPKIFQRKMKAPLYT